MSNFFNYFDYKEYKSATKNDDGTVSSVQILYGFELKDGFEAYNSGEFKDTLTVNFTADGIVYAGDFTVDYETLEYSGTVTSSETRDIEEDLVFWAKGNRTEIWAFGNYSSSYITYLTNFSVTAVEGCIYLKNS